MFDLLLMIHFYVKCIEDLSPKLTQAALSHPCIYVIFFCFKKILFVYSNLCFLTPLTQYYLFHAAFSKDVCLRG